MARERMACRGSPGLASRGQRAVQSLHWWQSQMDGSAASRSTRPHCAQRIWRRGKTVSGVARSQTAEQVAQAGYRGFMAGRRLVVPGIGNKLGAFVMRFVPDFALVPLMGWLFRVRDDQGNVLWPRPLPKPPDSKRAAEAAKLKAAD